MVKMQYEMSHHTGKVLTNFLISIFAENRLINACPQWELNLGPLAPLADDLSTMLQVEVDWNDAVRTYLQDLDGRDGMEVRTPHNYYYYHYIYYFLSLLVWHTK